MKSREWPGQLYDIAENQLGYFTAAQAQAAGVHQVRLVQLDQTGDIERVSRGVYRLARFPVSPHGQYMEAILWPQVRRPDVRGVISHVSALALYELTEVNPSKVHITLDPAIRVRRAVPRQLALHFATLSARDVHVVDGVPVTTPERTIRDVHTDHLGPALVRKAIADGRRTGRLTYALAERLARELLGESIDDERSAKVAARPRSGTRSGTRRTRSKINTTRTKARRR
jgi:predicted transcriptional regulator of viral defense system